MTTSARLGAFVAAMAAVAVLGFGLGRAVGPIDVGGDGPSPHEVHGTTHPDGDGR